MPLETRKHIFGIHQITAYNTATRLPLGTAKVVGSAALQFSGELVELMGGSNLFPWAIETGPISTEMSISLREYPNWFFPAFLGQEVTENSAEASAAIGTALANAKGTSVLQASTGIATVSVKSGSEADVKTGNYVVKAVSATTVDVYALSDVDFAQGTDKEFVDETMKITSSPLTITASTAVEIPGFGLELTGGSGTIGMTADDTAVFDARAINDGSDIVTVGKNTDVYQEIGMLISAQRKGNNEIVMIDVFRAKGIGIPFNLAEKEMSESEITIKAFRDEARNGVFEMKRVRASS